MGLTTIELLTGRHRHECQSTFDQISYSFTAGKTSTTTHTLAPSRHKTLDHLPLMSACGMMIVSAKHTEKCVYRVDTRGKAKLNICREYTICFLLAGGQGSRLIQSHHVAGYQFGGREGRVTPDRYWRDVGTLNSYFDANMDLLAPVPSLDLYQGSWPIRTYQGQHPPARVAPGPDCDAAVLTRMSVYRRACRSDTTR